MNTRRPSLAAVASLCCLLFFAFSLPAEASLFGGKKRNFICYVKLDTTLGEITLELYYSRAPRTVEYFLGRVNSGTYNGTVFHAATGSALEGGAFTAGIKPVDKGEPAAAETHPTPLDSAKYMAAIPLESGGRLVGGHFFIMLAASPTQAEKRECRIFGKVVGGQEIVDTIARQLTVGQAGRAQAPPAPVIIKRAWEYTDRVHGV